MKKAVNYAPSLPQNIKFLYEKQVMDRLTDGISGCSYCACTRAAELHHRHAEQYNDGQRNFQPSRLGDGGKGFYLYPGPFPKGKEHTDTVCAFHRDIRKHRKQEIHNE